MALSVCLIVKNEEEVIARCLNCVKKFADEIVAVDTGSTDKTVEIIKTFIILSGATIFPPPETLRSVRRTAIILCGLMRTT